MNTTETPAEVFRLAQRFRISIDALRHAVRTQGPEQAVTWTQETVLLAVQRLGPVSTADLARHERVRPQSMGAVVIELVRAELLDKTRDPSHGRRELLTLTRRGVDTLDRLAEVKDAQLALYLAQASNAEREALETTVSILEKFEAHDVD
jgi:DNA-binding MarR family transcriptional regulator